jgi:hypothetical protein
MPLDKSTIKYGDTVKIKGSHSQETGIVTGIVTKDEYVRVYWNSTNNLYHETVHVDVLEVVRRAEK